MAKANGIFILFIHDINVVPSEKHNIISNDIYVIKIQKQS